MYNYEKSSGVTNRSFKVPRMNALQENYYPTSKKHELNNGNYSVFPSIQIKLEQALKVNESLKTDRERFQKEAANLSSHNTELKSLLDKSNKELKSAQDKILLLESNTHNKTDHEVRAIISKEFLKLSNRIGKIEEEGKRERQNIQNQLDGFKVIEDQVDSEKVLLKSHLNKLENSISESKQYLSDKFLSLKTLYKQNVRKSEHKKKSRKKYKTKECVTISVNLLSILCMLYTYIIKFLPDLKLQQTKSVVWHKFVQGKARVMRIVAEFKRQFLQSNFHMEKHHKEIFIDQISHDNDYHQLFLSKQSGKGFYSLINSLCSSKTYIQTYIVLMLIYIQIVIYQHSGWWINEARATETFTLDNNSTEILPTSPTESKTYT